jgi:hypothetical protein
MVINEINRIKTLMGIINEGKNDSYTTINNNKIYFGKNTLFDYIDIPSGTKFTLKDDKISAWGGSLEFTCGYFGVVNFDEGKGYKRFKIKGKSYWSKDLQIVLKSKFCVGNKTKKEIENKLKEKEIENKLKEKEKTVNNNSPYGPCKKCIGSYGGLMGDDCAYEAVERFEENYGTAAGTSMGINYFEGNWKRFDNLIVNRIIDTIGGAWDAMDSKFRMQLWSFMYNSDSSSKDNYRWLAVLYVTANPEVTEFDSSITSKIIGKRDPKMWDKAVKVVSEFSNWNSNYDKFLRMIDGQYKTYSNKGAYAKSWAKRPQVMSDMYDECKSK